MRVHSQAFLEAMRSLTDGVRWKGIGGPSDGASDKTFAIRVREAVNKYHSDIKWEQKGGHSAAKRGTSAWHIYNYELQRRVEAPADEDGNARNKRQRPTEAPPAPGRGARLALRLERHAPDVETRAHAWPCGEWTGRCHGHKDETRACMVMWTGDGVVHHGH